MSVPQSNADCRWDDFDPVLYLQQNYLEVRDDDLRIVQAVRDFFADAFDVDRPVDAGIDVGTGPNLYPALCMLPFCRRITLWERSGANVRRLQQETQRFSPMWDGYWNVLRGHGAYRRVPDPRQALRSAARVHHGDLFRLPERRWNAGTMFFVAESLSSQQREFRLAVRRFFGALTPGAPFAVAFMAESTGYDVGAVHFPAVAVTEADVDECLRPHSPDVATVVIRSSVPLRDGYSGMVLGMGHNKS